MSTIISTFNVSFIWTEESIVDMSAKFSNSCVLIFLGKLINLHLLSTSLRIQKYWFNFELPKITCPSIRDQASTNSAHAKGQRTKYFCPKDRSLGQKYLVWFLVQMRKGKFAFEIYWPLAWREWKIWLCFDDSDRIFFFFNYW